MRRTFSRWCKRYPVCNHKSAVLYYIQKLNAVFIIQEECAVKNPVINEIQSQIDAGLIQGAVVKINSGRETLALGFQAGPIPMTEESRFDIASAGKVFTAACAAILAFRGKLDLDAPFTAYLPEHALGKECTITVRDLACHASGFDNSKPYASDEKERFMKQLCSWLPVNPRRSSFVYSCGNYVLLGKIVERVSGMDLDQLSRTLFWKDLGMIHTTWNAPGPGPLEVQHHHPVREPGEHNDEVCCRAGVPLGSGSVFSTAGDMLCFLTDVLQSNVLPRECCRLMLTPEFSAGEKIRSFGWDMSADGIPSTLSPRTIHHTGWTGQSIFVDPETGICGAVLTSRTGNWQEAKTGRLRIMDAMVRTMRSV